MVKRIESGVKGFDELMEGGFPAERIILLTGVCGTGKSIFASKFLLHGAEKFGEKVLYFTFDEIPRSYHEDMDAIGLNIKELEKKGLFKVIDMTQYRANLSTNYGKLFGKISAMGFIDKVREEIIKEEPTRVVIDSISGIIHIMNLEEGDHTQYMRDVILRLLVLLMGWGEITTMIVTDVPEEYQKLKLGRHDEEFTSDVVIQLLREDVADGDVLRSLRVIKARGTSHPLKKFPVEIKFGEGIVVFSGED